MRLSTDVFGQCSDDLEKEYQTHVKNMISNSSLAATIGAWLGDDERSSTDIANVVGPEIVTWLRNYAAFLGMRVFYYYN